MTSRLTRRRSLPAVLALTTVTALALSACGGSSTPGGGGSTPTPAAAGAAGGAAGADMVTAIPALQGVGTTVILNASTLTALKGLGVAVAPFAGAQFDGAKGEITFPITGGYAEIHGDKAAKPGYIQGSIQHEGSGFSLSAGGTKVVLSEFVVDPGNSKLYGSVTVNGGTPMVNVPLLDLDGSKVEVSMPGGNLQLLGTVAKLSATAVGALNKVFKTDKLAAGTPLGVVRLVASAQGVTTYPASDAAAAIPRLSGVGTTVQLNPATLKAVEGLGVKIAPFGSAKFATSPQPQVTFPITGGDVVIHTNKAYQPGYIAGIVVHEGSGLTFSAGGKTLTVSDFEVDPGNSILTASVAGKPGFPLLSLDGSKVELQKEGSNPVLFGTVAKLTQQAAAALNKTFATDKVMPGTPLGVVRIVAQAGS